MAQNRMIVSISRRLHVRLSIWLPAVVMAALFVVYIPMVTALLHASSTTLSPVATAASVQPKTAASAVQAAAVPAAVATPAVATQPTPACTPMSFGTPAQLPLSSAPAGLSVQADSPSYYRVYGNDSTAVRDQIRRCAPGSAGSASAEFTGETSYGLSWQYDTTSTGSSCTLSNVKIGLHTAIALPLWQPTAAASPAYAAKWQSFAANLAIHEQGHASIDTLYATRLLSDLNALGTLNCATAGSTVAATINADVAALNGANATYDAQTNHGATQGAILP